MTTERKEYPYYQWSPDKYEGRYWNINGLGVAIIASVGVEGAWSAYIGASTPMREEETLAQVLYEGAKLSEKDARHFFPEIDLPYRN